MFHPLCDSSWDGTGYNDMATVFRQNSHNTKIERCDDQGRRKESNEIRYGIDNRHPCAAEWYILAQIRLLDLLRHFATGRNKKST